MDAWNITAQRQLTDTMSVEVGYVANHGRHVFGENNPDDRGNEAAIDGFVEGIPTAARRPFFAGGVRENVLGIGGAYGWTQDVLLYFNEAQNWYQSMQAKFTRRFSDGWSAQINYTLQKGEGEQDQERGIHAEHGKSCSPGAGGQGDRDGGGAPATSLPGGVTIGGCTGDQR